MENNAIDNNGWGGYRWGYRDKARIISIVDIVMSTLNLGNTFLHFLAVSAYSSWLNSVDPDHTKVWVDFGQNNIDRDPVVPRGEIVFAPHTVKKLAWMLVLAQFAIHFSQLVFAINLYTGTARRTPAKAHSACRLWFITSSLLLGILGIRIFFHHRDSHMVYNMSEIIFRAVGMYIVGEYAKQIKRDGTGLLPPPVYFSSHSDSHHHHHASTRTILGAYPVQQSIPIFYPPHHVESPPKYEEVILPVHSASTNGIPGTGSCSDGVESLIMDNSAPPPAYCGTESESSGSTNTNGMQTRDIRDILSRKPRSPPKYEDIIKGVAESAPGSPATPGGSTRSPNAEVPSVIADNVELEQNQATLGLEIRGRSISANGHTSSAGRNENDHISGGKATGSSATTHQVND